MKLGFGFILCIAPLLAHHSIFAEYDTSRIVTLKGTITKVEFMNPHVRFNLDVAESDGKVTRWLVETLPPNTLKRIGAGKDSFKEGDQLSVDVWVAKDGSKSANALTLVWSDGRTLIVGDRSTTTTFKGTVTSVKWSQSGFGWTDSSSYLYVDVVGADGKVANWTFDMTVPAGFNQESLKPGDRISIAALVPPNGGKSASARVLTLPDGHSVVVGGAWLMTR